MLYSFTDVSGKKVPTVLKIAICDDEMVYLDRARSILEQYATENNLEYALDTFSNASALLDSIEGGARHDIYLLDIYMPGVSGMSVATELRSKGVRSPIVFLTSSTEHAVEAFGVDATHYLLKPYTEQNFFTAMDKAMQSISSHADECIVLKIDGEYQNIQLDHLMYCEASGNYQRLFMNDGAELPVRMTASELYDMLELFSCFYRCGRAYILNLNHVKKITSNSAILKSGHELPLPRTAISGLRSAFFDYFN